MQSEKKEKLFETNFEGKKVVFVFNEVANKCEKSVVCHFGNTVVLTTLTLKKGTKKFYSFFPLTVFFEERTYAMGRIPGGVFNRREVKPDYNCIKNARTIDRTLRSLFFSDLYFGLEVQVFNLILSVDKECNPLLAASWASFLVCYLSPNLPFFDRVIATVVVGKKKNKLACHLSSEELFFSPVELVVSADENTIISLELRGNEVREEEIEEILNFSFEKIRFLILFFKEIIKQFQLNKKLFLNEEKEQQNKYIKNRDEKKKEILSNLEEIFDGSFSWLEKEKKFGIFFSELKEKFSSFSELEKNNSELVLEKICDECLLKKMHEKKEKKGIRLDERKEKDIRSLLIKIDYLPKSVVHGSALFSRGETQVLSIATIGKMSDKQCLEVFSQCKYFIHHYNFLDFSVNKISAAFRSVSRREIGHGELVEKTFFSLLPSVDSLPCTVRVVSEVLSSDGSSSQASICATSLALISSGLPLSRMAAGVSLGLFFGCIYTDINALEDKLSEMDFKIAGTEEGVCSAQLDVKKQGLDLMMIKQCFQRAKEARLFILQKMKEVVFSYKNFFPAALKWKKIYIGDDCVGILIGPGGKTINKLIKDSGGASIEVHDGFVFVYHHLETNIQMVCEQILKLMKERKRS